MVMPFDEAALVKDYTPLVMLYPEIRESIRERNPNYPHESPLLYDYHPRDIRIVLEHSSLHYRFRPWKGRTRSWEEMLDRVEKARYQKNLDLLPGVALDDRDDLQFFRYREAKSRKL